MQEGLYISFDFGLRRIGVAVGQTITKNARPLETLLAKEGVPQWDQIQKVLNEWDPVGIVVGIPLNMDDTEQEITFAAREFITSLKEKTTVPIYEMDERLSTVAAKEEIFEQSGAKGLKKSVIDGVAAKIILESWFRHH